MSPDDTDRGNSVRGMSQEEVDELSLQLEALLGADGVDYEGVVRGVLEDLPDSEYGSGRGPEASQ